jgi:hypothetical protein
MFKNFLVFLAEEGEGEGKRGDCTSGEREVANLFPEKKQFLFLFFF